MEVENGNLLKEKISKIAKLAIDQHLTLCPYRERKTVTNYVAEKMVVEEVINCTLENAPCFEHCNYAVDFKAVLFDHIRKDNQNCENFHACKYCENPKCNFELF